MNVTSMSGFRATRSSSSPASLDRASRLTSLGYDVDRPWRELPKKERDWILFTDEQPVVPVFVGYNAAEARRAQKRGEEPSYRGNFSSAKRYALSTFASTESPAIKRRVSRYVVSSECPLCKGKRLRRESLSVTFAGHDIGELSRLPLKQLERLFSPLAAGNAPALKRLSAAHPEKAAVTRRIATDLAARLAAVLDLGLGYLSLERSTPTLSPGELQRLRLATQVRSNLFGVVYVLDEPSAGLHPQDTAALLDALSHLKDGGNSLFVVEHDLDVIRRADWIVDVGPAAGEQGGSILYSGPPEGLAAVKSSQTARYLYEDGGPEPRATRRPTEWLRLQGVSRNNLHGVDVSIPLGALTSVSGVSGSGKSSLVSQALVDLVSARLGQPAPTGDDEGEELERAAVVPTNGTIACGMDRIERLVRVDQKPIGRTPRSNLATYTGLFDPIRSLFASTKAARARGYDAGRFSFNVAKGRCATCSGEGSVMVELLFLPSVYAPCPTCRGARYNPETLAIKLRDKNVADVLALTVSEACAFFAGDPAVLRALEVVREVGLGYLRLGQPATELSGGEAQRIKLATELQRTQRGSTLYVLDEPTTGLHPADVEKLIAQLDGLVAAGNTVIVVEHEMRVIARSDWVIDVGPGAGDEGGRIVAAGRPADLAKATGSRTAPYLKRFLGATRQRGAA